MKSKSEIFNSHKTIIDGKEVLTYGNTIKAMEELENQFCQADVSGQSELLLAFGRFIDADCALLGNGYIESMVKKFQASNSH